MAIKTKQLRRLYEAAVVDEKAKNLEPKGERFYADLKEGMESGAIKPTDFSIRELMEEFITDANGNPCGREIVDSWNPRHGGGSDGLCLTKLVEGGAVQVSNFSNITGQIVYNQILPAYQSEEFTFTKEIPTTDTQFNGERIAGIGNIGDEAEVVGEGQVYPMAGVNEDWIDTPVTTKRGLILPLTKEAAFFDRTGVLLQRASKVGDFLGINKEKRAVDCMIDENTTAHRYNRKNRGQVATYGANSGNHDWNNIVTSNALSNWLQVDNADQALYNILDPNTGEPIQITGKLKLIVARGLVRTAQYVQRMTEFRIMTPGYATSGNPIQTVSPSTINNFDIVTSRYVGNRQALTTSWYYGDPSKAFAYMQNWPMQVVEAPANSELEFNQDIVMRWKASERGQFAVVEPRYVVKSTA